MRRQVQGRAIPSRFAECHARKVDAYYSGFVELREVGLVEEASPVSFIANPAGHRPSIQLTTGMRLIQPETEGELTGIAVPCRFDVVFGGIPYAPFGRGIGEFSGDLKQHRCATGVVEGGDRPVTEHTVERRRHVPSRLGDLASLRGEVPSGNDETDRSLTDVFVDRRIVVEVEARRVTRIPRHVVISGVLPPAVECVVMAGLKKFVVEPQTEARATQSIGPYLSVLAVAAHLAIVPLRGQVRGHARMAPGECVVTVADHLEGSIPLRIARYVSV